jgi:hypothetical protein
MVSPGSATATAGTLSLPEGNRGQSHSGKTPGVIFTPIKKAENVKRQVAAQVWLLLATVRKAVECLVERRCHYLNDSSIIDAMKSAC